MKSSADRHIMLYLFLYLASLGIGCQSHTEKPSNRVYFEISPLDRKIVIDALLKDSIKVKITFDSGAGAGTFILDSAFCNAHQEILGTQTPDGSGLSGSAWANKRIRRYWYFIDHTVKIGNAILKYDHIAVDDRRGYYNTSGSDGLFNIPQNDTTHVWELNFEHSYLEIHPIENFKMPQECFIFPLVKSEIGNYPFNIQMPLNITFPDGDTLNLSRTFMIDTGISDDIALLSNAKELCFFNEKVDAVWISFMNNYFRYHTVNAELIDLFKIDSLRIYTHNYPTSIKCNYLIGTNFLKRFNVYFDIKNQRIGLLPITNFKRVVNPELRRFHFSTEKSIDGRLLVKEVGEYADNYYKTAGLQRGDELLTVNGIQFKDVSRTQMVEFHKMDTVLYQIIRDGKILSIAIRVDKNEKQGD